MLKTKTLHPETAENPPENVEVRLRAFLFEVEPTDPTTFIGAGVLFVLVALLACWVPTRRAGQVDPLEALRYE